MQCIKIKDSAKDEWIYWITKVQKNGIFSKYRLIGKVKNNLVKDKRGKSLEVIKNSDLLFMNCNFVLSIRFSQFQIKSKTYCDFSNFYKLQLKNTWEYIFKVW